MKKNFIKDCLESEYKNAIKIMKHGNIVYCSSCNAALSSERKQFLKHIGKHLMKYIEVLCLYCEEPIKMPKVRGVRYVKWGVIHTKHKIKKDG